MLATLLKSPLSPMSLDNSLLWTLVERLTEPTEPAAGDPAQLMVRAKLTPDPWQADFLQSSWQRALLLCSRQAGKSTVTAALATHTAYYQPQSLTLLLSVAQRQSSELFRKVKRFYYALPQR